MGFTHNLREAWKHCYCVLALCGSNSLNQLLQLPCFLHML
jgi:hypothetical protein